MDGVKSKEDDDIKIITIIATNRKDLLDKAFRKGRIDLEKHDMSLRIYTRFSSERSSMFGFLRSVSLNALANKVQMNSRNDANYYSAELADLPSIEVEDDKTQVFLTNVEGDVEHNNFLSTLRKIK